MSYQENIVAEGFFKAALNDAERNGVNDPAVASCLVNLALVYHELNRQPEAEAALRRSLAIWRSVPNPDPKELAVTVHNLAYACHRQRKDTDAEPLYMRAVSLAATAYKTDALEPMDMLHDAASFYRDIGNWSAAEALLRSEISRLKITNKYRLVRMSRCLTHVGEMCEKQGRFEEAKAAYSQALALGRIAFAGDIIRRDERWLKPGEVRSERCTDAQLAEIFHQFAMSCDDDRDWSR